MKIFTTSIDVLELYFYFVIKKKKKKDLHFTVRNPSLSS